MNGRNLVAKWSSFAARERVYQTADGYEVEKSEHYDVEERRVFFDDVHLVTIHREYGTTYLIGTGLIALMTGALAALFYFVDPETWPFAVFFAIFGAPWLVAFLIRALFGVDVVTIFGRRSKATMRFRLRKAKAREVYEQACAAVRDAQQRREPDA